MAVAPTDAKADETAGNVEKEEPSDAQDLIPKAKDIFLLVRQQNFAVALKLLEAYPQHWTATDDEGHSLLHWGSLVGSREFCNACLVKGVNVDSLAANKQTPLMWAVLRGHLQVARLLLDNKANIQAHDSLGATPLIIAIQHKNHPCMLLLLHRGKKVLLDDADKNGCTPAHWAAYKGDLTALKFLDYFDADILALDNSKMLPLHRAVCASKTEVLEFLLEKRSDASLRNQDGKTVLDIAEEQQDQSMHKLLRRLTTKGESKGESSGVPQEETDVEQGDHKPTRRESILRMMLKAGQDKTAQKAFPVFWLVCLSMAVAEYLMDLRATSYEVAPVASLLFEVGVPMSLILFTYVALSDPGKIPARPKGNSGVEELMRALDSDGPQMVDINRLCTTTWVLKGLRTKYCTQTGACVEEFDHWCVWLNSSIGKNNHRQFLCLALVEWLTQLCHVYLCWCMARALVPYPSFFSWLCTVVASYPLLSLVWLIQILTVPFVLMLLVYQSRLIAMNLTTNEMMNAGRYPHFWVTAQVMPGRVQQMYRNPFSKGSIFSNCMDFWWFRNRSRMVEMHGGCHAPGCRSCQKH